MEPYPKVINRSPKSPSLRSILKPDPFGEKTVFILYFNDTVYDLSRISDFLAPFIAKFDLNASNCLSNVYRDRALVNI